MKKIFLAVICAVMAVSFSGCFSTGGASPNGSVQTSEAPDSKSIKADDYDDNLDGLEKYFIALGYIPKDSEPTQMLYSVIGATDGDRYYFSVNNSSVYVELYQYNPNNLDDKAQRVINEVKKDGKFYVFDNSVAGGNTPYEATLSDNGKYLMIYTDKSEVKENVQRKADVINALKAFHK